MAKYIASPYGDLSGKLGNTVAAKYRGKNTVRAYKKPKVITRKENWLKWKKGEGEFSVRGCNFCRLGGMFFYILKTHHKDLILPIWEKYCKKRRLILTGGNLFVKINMRLLYRSIPHPDQILNQNNLPDYKKMFISYGRLEPPLIVSAKYNDKKLIVNWDNRIWQNGNEDDIANIALYILPTNEEIEDFKPYGKLILLNTSQPIYRKTAKIEIPLVARGFQPRKKLNGSIIYLYFKNKKGDYSISRSAGVYPPP